MTINFNKKIYKLVSIKMAIKEFGEWADFNLEKKDKYYTVNISNPKDHTLEKIKDEFCNYVLHFQKAG